MAIWSLIAMSYILIVIPHPPAPCQTPLTHSYSHSPCPHLFSIFSEPSYFIPSDDTRRARWQNDNGNRSGDKRNSKVKFIRVLRILYALLNGEQLGKGGTLHEFKKAFPTHWLTCATLTRQGIAKKKVRPNLKIAQVAFLLICRWLWWLPCLHLPLLLSPFLDPIQHLIFA